MKNCLVLFLAMTFLLSCSDEGLGPRVNLRVFNSSNLDFDEVSILAKGGTSNYKEINRQSFSDYEEIMGLTEFINIFIVTVNADTIEIFQIDPPMDEKLFPEGNYTCRIGIVDDVIDYEIIED